MSNEAVIFVQREVFLDRPFGVRLDRKDHLALMQLSQRRGVRRNRLIIEAVRMLIAAESKNVEPPAA